MRKTELQVSFAGCNITEDILKYLKNITYTDNDEDEADDLQINLHDREDIWLTQWLASALGEEEPGAEPTAAETQTTANYTVNAKSGLRVRAGAGTNYARLDCYPFGTPVTVLGTEGNWSIVDYNGQKAYMYTKYLTPHISTTTSSTSNGTSTNVDISSYPTLQYGSNGEYVSIMQQALLNHGQQLPVYGVDGRFRSETLAALKAFQSSVGITVDGICGQITWQKLFGIAAEEQGGQGKGFKVNASIIKKDWNGDGVDEILECGQFELDTVECSGAPNTVVIKATSLPYSAKIRQTKKSRAWEKYTLSGIANEMAANAGMTTMYLSDYDPTISRMEQDEQSDIEFLRDVCHKNGISLKVSNNVLILFDQISYEKLESVRTIRKNDGTYSKWKLSTSESGTKYASCKVSYTTPEGTLIEGVAKVEDYDEKAKNNQELVIREKVGSVGEAQLLAEKYLRLRNKFQKTASFDMSGDVKLVASATVDLVGWGAWSGKYIIVTAKHTIDSNGYKTSISLRNVLEGY